MIKTKEKRISAWLTILILYPLFMPRSLKLLYAPVIDGVLSTNEVYIIGALAVIGICRGISYTFYRRKKLKVSKLTGVIIAIFIVFSLNVLINTSVNEQNIYALIVSTMPLLFLIVTRPYLKRFDVNFLRFVSIIAVIYSILAIYNSTHSSLSIGNAYVISGNQARVSLPIGSPTTVVFYFIASLPLVNLAISIEKNKKLRTVFQVGFWLIILASLLTLSRAGAAVIITLAAWGMYNRSKKTTFAKRLLGIALLISGGLFVGSFIVSNFDFSRLVMGFSDSSVSERSRALALFFEIFKHNPIFGTGCGEYFTRVYKSLYFSDRIISAYGYSGLRDPHSFYMLLLSENGIVGFMLYLYLFYLIYRKYSMFKDSDYKSAAFQLLAGVLVYCTTSSDLLNLVGLTAIIYTYMMFFLCHNDRNKLIMHKNNLMQ